MESDLALGDPIPEKDLRDLARNVSKALPDFGGEDIAKDVK